MQRYIVLKWTLLITILGGFTLAARIFVEKEIAHTREKIVGNHEIISAFLANDSEAIHYVSRQYQLQYQRIQYGKVALTTEQGLPTPQIIPIRTVVAAGVLPENPTTLLETLAPYRVLRRDGLYVAIPIIPDGLDASGYIVYARVLP